MDIAIQFSHMKTRVNPTASANWNRNWKVGVRIWFEREGQAVLGAGRAELLAAIDTEHSITKAAKAAGMSYRKAWTMIQEVNAAAGEPLVEAAVGGKQGGGAASHPKVARQSRFTRPSADHWPNRRPTRSAISERRCEKREMHPHGSRNQPARGGRPNLDGIRYS